MKFISVKKISWPENDNTPRVIQRKEEEEEESWPENDNMMHVNQRKEDKEEGNLTYREKSKN